jgi:hypothetical protein
VIIEEKPESEQWPDSLWFWFAVTFGVIAVSVGVCAGGLALVRTLWTTAAAH